ncbi:MAG TPA: FlgD immunoglobulin-like domain containing protein [Candidatus Eisenbacteria bacterium]|jgi:hypothetical protein
MAAGDSRCTCLVVAIACLVLARSAPADCTSSGVHLNEVRYVDAPLPDGGTARIDASVELFNKGAAAAGLGGWRLADQAGVTRAVLAGTLSLPAGAYLEVVFGSGEDDLDFADGIGTIHTGGDSVGVFAREAGAVALYDAGNTIRDYVAWSCTGSPPAGVAASDAAAAGIWPSAGAVAGSLEQTFFTIRLVPDGFDHDQPSDWRSCGWGQSGFGSLTRGPNALQLDPVNGAGLDPGPVTLLWDSVPAAVSYHLRVVDGSGGTEFDQLTSDTRATLSLPAGPHRWSVAVVDACGEAPPTSTWSFTVFSTAVSSPAPEFARGEPGTRGPRLAPIPSGRQLLPGMALIGLQLSLQHKDTRLLCVSSPDPSWPGCAESAGDQGPWDDAHPLGHAEHYENGVGWVQCDHCKFYCARAANQMINAYYGGNLSQDRLSYAQMELGDRGAENSPDGDLCGHFYHSWWGTAPAVIEWAVSNSVVSGPFDPDYAAIRAEIRAGYPVRVTYGGGKTGLSLGCHAVVVDGYIDAFAFIAFPTQDMLHVLNPWPTDRGIGPGGWLDFAAIPIGKWFRIRPAGNAPLTGRMQEAAVTTDTDGDGVMDFDEGNPDFAGHGPRGFESRGDRVDTDGDQVADKQEIRSYAFHALDHPNHPAPNLDARHHIGPDPDHDAIRAERDPDSDHDGTFDGGEDKNGNGRSPEAGETCVYYPNPTPTELVPDHSPFVTTEPVTLTGVGFHASSNYTYYVYQGCPLTFTAGSPYTGYHSAGSVASDASGTFHVTLTGLGEGCYTVVVDVLQDGLYGEVLTMPGGGTTSEVLDRTTAFSVTSTASASPGVPRALGLALASNPARGSVGLVVSLPAAGRTRLAVYDVSGQLVRVLFDGWSRAGIMPARWDGRNAAGARVGSGVYYARLEAATGSLTRKVIRLD